MAITSKELAKMCFYNAEALEKKQRERGSQDFAGVLKLYKNAIKLDPTHTKAQNNLARLYEELKLLAESYFQKAVALEKEQGKQDLDELFRLYEEVVMLDPTHKGAKHKIDLLDMHTWMEYFEGLLAHARTLQHDGTAYESGSKSNGIPNPIKAAPKYQEAIGVYDKLIAKLDAELADGPYKKYVDYNDRIKAIKEVAKKEKAAVPNIWAKVEHFEKLLAQARALRQDANSYEIGRNDNGVPNPITAIQKYQEAIDGYNDLIDQLNTELADGPYKECAEYNDRIITLKEAAEKEKSPLDNIQTRNDHYLRGLEHEARAEIDGKTSYAAFIAACKDAMVEYKKAANLGHAGGYSRLARLLYRIEGKVQESIALYEKAIAGGDVAALNELGVLYEKEKIKGKIEYDKAIKYYDAAIKLGDTNAMLNRAHLYVMGHGNNGIPQYDKALELYKLAHTGGNKNAQGEMDKLAERLNDEMKTLFLATDKGENDPKDTPVSPEEAADYSPEQDNKENDPSGSAIINQNKMALTSSVCFLPPPKKGLATAATSIPAKGM